MAPPYVRSPGSKSQGPRKRQVDQTDYSANNRSTAFAQAAPIGEIGGGSALSESWLRGDWPERWINDGIHEVARLYLTAAGAIEAVTATGRVVGTFPTTRAATAAIFASRRGAP